MIMCPICGAGNADTAKFCSECGKALTAEGVGSATPVVPVTPTPQSTTVLLSNDSGLSPLNTRAIEHTVAAPTSPASVGAYEPTMVGSGVPVGTEPTVQGSVFTEPTIVGNAVPVPMTSEPTQAYRPNTAPMEPTQAYRPTNAPMEPTQAYRPDPPTAYSGPTVVSDVRPPIPPQPAQQPGAFPDFRETLDRIQRASPLVPTVRKADILFVVDCTGSMQGEIDAIRDTILDFVSEIERDGIRVRVGLLAFGDRLNGEESFVFRFEGETFTKDAAIFRREVSRLRAGGGGDIPESSLDALLLALRQPFAPDASRVIVLVTDAPPHIPDMEAQSVGQVAAAIQAAGIKQLYLVIRTQDPTSGVYLTLLEGTQGLAFELGSGENFRSRAENFKKTLRALGRTISTGTR